MNTNTFKATLKKCCARDRKTLGVSVRTIATELGFKNPNSIHGAISTGKVSIEAFEALCARWPELTSTLDVSKLKRSGRFASKPAVSTGAEVVQLYPKKSSASAKSLAADFSLFELGYSLHGLARTPEAARWIEILEAAAKNNLPLQQVVSALKMPEVRRGIAS